MQQVNTRRSQAILRMPVDMVDVTVILGDGDRAEVLLFIPPSEDVARFVSEGGPFMPVIREANTQYVSRASLAAVGVPARLAPRLEEGLPTEEHGVKVKLRGGTPLEGKLVCIVSYGQQRIADYLNQDTPYFLLHAGDTSYFVFKSNVISVTEL